MRNDRIIEGSFRLWSDAIGLGAIAAAAGWSTDHLHLRGDIINSQGRRATRHYAAIKAVALNVDEDVSAWLTAIADQIRRQDDLVAGLNSGQIEGVAWLAVFGVEIRPLPNVDELAIVQLTKQHVRVLMENYTDLDEDGRPRRTWLAPAHRVISASN